MTAELQARSHHGTLPGDNDSPAAAVARRELAAAVAAFLTPGPGQPPPVYGNNPYAPAIRGPVGHEPRPGRAPPGRLTNRRRQACAQLAGGHQSEGNDHA